MNYVVIGGNVTRDCHVRTIATGVSIVSFGLAVNDEYKKQDGSTSKRTHFIDCQRWTKHPGELEVVLKRGASVVVIGSLQQDSWEDKQTGAKRTAVRVKVEQVLPTIVREVMAQREAAAGGKPDDVGDAAAGESQDEEGLPF